MDSEEKANISDNPFQSLIDHTKDLQEMSDEEHDQMLAEINNPVMISYAILPAPPEHIGTFLSPDMKPVYVDYKHVDWKALASSLQSELDTLGVPKSVKVYVGTDAMDIFDVSQLDPDTHEINKDYVPVYEAYNCIKEMRFSDFRAGLMRFPEDADFHIKPPQSRVRTPITGLFIAFRFDRFMQSHDYLSGITGRLLNAPDSMVIQPGVHRDVAIPGVVKSWLEAQCNVVVGEEMDIYRMPPVYKGA